MCIDPKYTCGSLRVKCVVLFLGTLKLEVVPCPTEFKWGLTPELYKIDPYPDEKSRPTKEVLEFPIRDIYEPYSTYRQVDAD